jgi:hypothetical protein
MPPLTAKELAYLKAIPTVSRKIEKSIEAISDLTPGRDGETCHHLS